GASRENSPTRTRGGRDGPEETRPEAHTSGGGGASGGHESKHDRSSESNAQNQQRLETGLQRPSNGGLRHAGHRRSGHHYRRKRCPATQTNAGELRGGERQAPGEGACQRWLLEQSERAVSG